MFGLQINDYDKEYEGQYGYGLKLDISEYKPRRIDFVQASAQPLSVDAPVENNVDLADLQALPDSATCPDLSWCANNETLSIVFNSDTYDYDDDDCRFAFGGIRYPMLAVSDSDKIDVPDEYIDFLILLIRKYAWMLKKKMIDRDIEKSIRDRQQQIETE